jgi:uncharacterized membrane protein
MQASTKLARVLVACAIVGVLTFAGTAWIDVLVHRGARSIDLPLPGYAIAVAAGFAALILLCIIVRREIIHTRTLIAALFVALSSIAVSLLHPLGYEAVIASAALVLALVFALLLPEIPSVRWSDGRIALAIFSAVTIVDALFSMHRYYWFGAGSWDLGCEIHNAFRSSHFYDSTSTVLGDVDYLGDHFMIGIYLWAPFFWISSSGYMVLFVQCINLAAVAPVIYLLARDRGASTLGSIVLALCAGFAFGVQSAVYFDAHEINFGFGFLALGILALERKRLGWASVLFGAFAMFKESLGAYVLALGLLLVWRGVRDRDRRFIQYGSAWIASGAAWFVLVNRVFMPLLIARANAPEAHETFAEFGPTVFQAALGMITHPFKVVSLLFAPDEKTASLLVTFGGLGYLAFFSPEIAIPALPLLAERFLSSKSTMWEMGYHYAAPLSLYAAWAAAIGWPRALALGRRTMDALIEGLGHRAETMLALYVLASTLLMNAIGYRHPANFHEWMHGYFSTAERRETNAQAVTLLDGMGRDKKLAVQNRTLPHLADRPFIYRLGDWPKADFALLVINESAWPWDDGFPARLAHDLSAAADWKLIFSEGYTAVFARSTATDLAAVAPSAILKPYVVTPPP